MKAGQPVWIIINCHNKKEANTIGSHLLHERLIACFDIIPERLTAYFWPPRSEKIEKGKGTMLIAVSIPQKYKQITSLTRALHSDTVPFIGLLKIDQANPDYMQWLLKELQ